MDSSLLRSRLVELVATHAVPGAQFAVWHAGETWTWTHGVVRADGGAPMTVDAPVPVGSITKAVTAVAALVLVEDGDLALDRPLVGDVPELRELPPRLRGRLTLRHLLSHTGGLPCDAADVRAATSRRHVLDCCRSVEPLSDPGRVFSYSNIGYLLVGHAIASVTGMSWWEAVQSLVLDPLGASSRFVVGDRVPGDLVSGHSVRNRGRVRPVAQSLAAVEAAVGALAASALDLVAFGRGVLSGDVLAPALRRELCAAVPGAVPYGLADGWGLGLARYGPAHLATVGHDGNGDGTSCHLRMNTGTGTVVALTTNAGSGFALWRELAPRLPELGVPVGDYDPMALTGRPVEPADGCVGEYANGDLGYTVEHRDDDLLRLTVDGEPFADLTQYGDGRFAMRDCDTGRTDQTGRFVVDEHGRVTGLQVGGRLASKQRERVRLTG